MKSLNYFRHGSIASSGKLYYWTLPFLGKEFDIILECQDEKITDKNPLSHILQELKINEEIILKVLRDKKEISIKVKLEEKK